MISVWGFIGSSPILSIHCCTLQRVCNLTYMHASDRGQNQLRAYVWLSEILSSIRGYLTFLLIDTMIVMLT